MENFRIQVDDGSETTPDVVIKENTKSVTLFDWQERGIDYFFKHNHKVLYEVVTGGGKTFFSIELLKRIWKKDPDVRVLIVVPKNVILETGWYKELYDAGVSLKDIGVYYGDIKEYAKVTITNMQNLDRIALKLFQCFLVDEVHNFGTKRLLPFFDNDWKYMIGLSATVERQDNKHHEIIKLFDYNVFKYTPKQAINEGVINPFNFIDIAVELDSVTQEQYDDITKQINTILKTGGGFIRIMKGRNTELRSAMLSKMGERKQLVNNYPRKLDLVKIICDKHRNNKTIIFSQYNKNTNQLYWSLLDVGINSKIIHSGIAKQIRDQNLTDFRNDKYNVLLTSKVLDEGTNIPKIDVAIILASDSTKRQTIQRMGRVLRKKEKNSNLYQVYCKNTMEEDQSQKRTIFFKDLSSAYNYYFFGIDDKTLW